MPIIVMSSRSITALLVVLTFLAGCTAPSESMQPEEDVALTPVPSTLSFTAPTLDRAEDGGARHDLRSSFDGPVLLLWVAAGCSGCHDWTAMLKQELESGNISNTTNIVSIHRYPAFESVESVAQRYGDENASHHTPWPLLLPAEDTTVIDAESGRMTDVNLYRAFQQPVTPTLQVLDADGRLVWVSKTYWANSTVLAEALNIMNTGGR
jgi:hypothetical protein